MNTEEQIHRQSFGTVLQQMRLEAGLSQGFVAKACGFKTPQFISNMERGVCWAPMNVLAKMAVLYNIPKATMLDHTLAYRKKVWASQLGIKSNNRTA